MKSTSFLTAACAMSLTACVIKNDPPSAVDRAIPTADQVKIKLPASTTKSLGDLSNYYVITRDLTRGLNGGSAWVLVLIHAIVEQPPTTVAGNVYTWGPGSDALDPADYRLDVTANADGTFDYTLSGQNKTNLDGFKAVIQGHANPAADDQGNGDFSIDFDASRVVNPIDSGDAKGKVIVNYDIAARHLDMVASSVDANGNPASFKYAYDEADDGSGDMAFQVDADIGGTAAIENVTLRSRWENTGAGRGDARISGGDLGADQAIASECWSTQFLTTFYTDNVNFQPTQGDAGSCAFADVDLPPAM
jgi:hypothetical protein